MKDLTYIHYGSTSFNIEEYDEIKNVDFSKPAGGFWASPANSEIGWKHFLDATGWAEYNEENSFSFQLQKECRLCVIDSFKDLENLPSLTAFEHPLLKQSFPDFEKIKESYDAILLTPRGFFETKHSFHLSLWGWDCESLLILNPNIILQKEAINDTINNK